jgi:glycosyltransferase involved in cell wall biosynthesis
MGAHLKVCPWHISVLIPANNEEDLLPRCLHSILVARALLPSTVSCSLIVAVDSSVDQTLWLAQQILSGIDEVVATDAGNVGRARAVAASCALLRKDVSNRNHWLANTDADCCVPTNWLIDQLLLADSEVEAVAGIIDVVDFTGHEKGTCQRFRDSYLLKPDGTHHHIHGANLGMRADVYLRAGGWSGLSTGEDHCLWKRLQLSGAKTLSTTSLKVITSGRNVGRAPNGFAAALAAHDVCL